MNALHARILSKMSTETIYAEEHERIYYEISLACEDGERGMQYLMSNSDIDLETIMKNLRDEGYSVEVYESTSITDTLLIKW